MEFASLFRGVTEEPVAADTLAMGAYEALWTRPDASFKRIHEWTASKLTTDMVSAGAAETHAREILQRLNTASLSDVGIRLRGEPNRTIPRD